MKQRPAILPFHYKLPDNGSQFTVKSLESGLYDIVSVPVCEGLIVGLHGEGEGHGLFAVGYVGAGVDIKSAPRLSDNHRLRGRCTSPDAPRGWRRRIRWLYRG